MASDPRARLVLSKPPKPVSKMNDAELAEYAHAIFVALTTPSPPK